jgi:SAM-dependent methyltransferase
MFFGFDKSKVMLSSINISNKKNLSFTNSWRAIKRINKLHKFDLIFTNFSLHDNSNQKRIIKSLLSLIKKNGYLLIIDITKDDLPRLKTFLSKNMALPIKSDDFRLDVNKISNYLESLKVRIVECKQHLPKIRFGDSSFLRDYIKMFGIFDGMDLPLGPNRNNLKIIYDLEDLISKLEYPFIDQRVFGEYLIKKL